MGLAVQVLCARLCAHLDSDRLSREEGPGCRIFSAQILQRRLACVFAPCERRASCRCRCRAGELLCLSAALRPRRLCGRHMRLSSLGGILGPGMLKRVSREGGGGARARGGLLRARSLSFCIWCLSLPARLFWRGVFACRQGIPVCLELLRAWRVWRERGWRVRVRGWVGGCRL